MADSNDYLYGALDLLVLRALALGDAHGFGISQWMRRRTGDELQLEDAALYKALHRLERQELVTARWDRTESNRQAKFYRLTAAGRSALRARRAAWRSWVQLVDLVLQEA